ncbi:MAG: hypothetical protein ACREOZ_02210 [Gloeomargaritales cyanobacterium]
MSLRTPTQLSRGGTGLTAAYSAVTSGGDSFINDGRTVVAFKNTDAGAVTVTFAFGVTVDGQTVTGKTCVVAATTGSVITDVFPASYNDAEGTVNWTYSAAPAGLTVAILKFSKVGS